MLKGLCGLLRLRFVDRQLARYRAKEVIRIAEEMAKIIRKQKPDFVGFKLWNGDGFDGPVMMADFFEKTVSGVEDIRRRPTCGLFSWTYI